MTARLSDELVDALERTGDQPLRVENPRNHRLYVIVPEERFAPAPSAGSNGEWTEAKSARRFALIDKEIDGTLDPQEECEDGNTAAGDGCDAACKEEFDCAAEGGTPAGPACFFLATEATSCTDFCANEGLGYDEAATVALGSGGTDGACQTVLTLLGFTTGAVTGGGCDRGLGCWADVLHPPVPLGQGNRCTEPGTEGDAAPGTGDRRVCGCTEAQD